ncbi:MAG: metal ABC transporter substrate-binding protein [Vulcanimicrobiaceae bacterium]
MPLKIRAFALLLATLLLSGCGPHMPRVRVVTTTSTFASLVRAVGGSRVRVSSLVPVGTPVRSYRPTQQNVTQVRAAQLLVENGVGLEPWLGRLLGDAAAPKLAHVVLTRYQPIRKGNPYLWMDPVAAKAYIRKIRNALIYEDPKYRDTYVRNAFDYDGKLASLTAEIAKKIDALTPAQRTMIALNRRFAYYDARFGVRSVLVPVAQGAAPSAAQLARIAALAERYNVYVVFAGPRQGAKLERALGAGSALRVVDSLYVDSVGSDPRVATYISMLRHDTETIVAALKGAQTKSSATP